MTAETRIADALAAIGPISAQALAHGLGLGVSTVRHALTAMQDHGRIAHVATGSSQGGRPRKLWGLVA